MPRGHSACVADPRWQPDGDRWGRSQTRVGAGPERTRWTRPLTSVIRPRRFAVSVRSSKGTEEHHHVVQVVHGSGLLGYSRGECGLNGRATRSERLSWRWPGAQGQLPLRKGVYSRAWRPSPQSSLPQTSSPTTGADPTPPLESRAPDRAEDTPWPTSGMPLNYRTVRARQLVGGGWGQVGAAQALTEGALSLSWRTPSACSWSSRIHPMRRNGIRAGKVMQLPVSVRPSAKPLAFQLPLSSCAQKVASRLSWSGRLPRSLGSPLLCPVWEEMEASFIWSWGSSSCQGPTASDQRRK